MSMPGVVVACDALRADAGKWATAAGSLRDAQRVAEGITLADKLGSIPQFVGGAESLIAIYDRMKQKFTTALSDGSIVMVEVSGILMQVADTFEREDREAALRIKQEGADR
jgi:hypothetical protein